MKSLFLGLTFLLASFRGTLDVKEDSIAEPCQFWVEYEVECGNNFWLCIDSIPLDELMETSLYFMEGRC